MSKKLFLVILFCFFVMLPAFTATEDEIYTELQKMGNKDKIAFYYNSVLVLNRNGKYAVIKYWDNRDNQNIISANYEYDNVEKIQCANSENVFFRTTKNKKFGAYDNFGTLVTAPVYDDINISCEKKNESYKSEIFVVKNGNKKGAIRSNKNNYFLAIPIIYDNVDLLWRENDEYYIEVTQNNKKGLVFSTDRSAGLIMLPAVFDEISVNSRFVVVKQYGKYGAYLWERQIVPIKYDKVTPMGEGIIVTLNNQQGAYYDGNLVVPVAFDEIQTADKNLLFCIGDDNPRFIVKHNNKYGVYNLVPVEFDSVKTVYRGFVVEKNGKFGIYHMTKGKLYNPEFDRIYETSNTKLALEKNGQVVKEIDMNMQSFKENAGEAVIKTMFFPLFWGTSGLH